MSDTENIERNGNGKGKSVTVPAWTIPLLRSAGTVAVCLCIGYAKFVTLENKGTDNANRITKTEALSLAHEAVIAAIDRRLIVTESNQTRAEKENGEALIRIESQLKELRTDVKDLEKKVK